MMTVVVMSDLGPLGAVLGEGGEAQVIELESDPTKVFKRYREGDRLDPSAIDRLVAWRSALAPRDLALVDERTCWPLARVMEGRRLVGVVLPRIPGHFVATMQVASVRASRPRELQYLLRPAACDRLSIPKPSPLARWELARQFAEVADVLDRGGVVLGDQSEKNLLWSLQPMAFFLIDCDSSRLDGFRGVSRGKETPGWEDPTLAGSEPDIHAARYKSALAIHRMIVGSPAAPTTEAAIRSTYATCPVLGTLIASALCGDRRSRPRPGELLDTLRTAIPQGVAVPASGGGSGHASAAANRPRVALRVPSSRTAGHHGLSTVHKSSTTRPQISVGSPVRVPPAQRSSWRFAAVLVAVLLLALVVARLGGVIG